MQTKSKIQLIQETYALKHNFEDGLNNIMEKFNIVNNVFVLHHNRLSEASKGYFEIVSEHESLTDAIRNLNPYTQGIQVINNEKFNIGNLYSFISECSDTSKVMDLNSMKSLY